MRRSRLGILAATLSLWALSSVIAKEEIATVDEEYEPAHSAILDGTDQHQAGSACSACHQGCATYRGNAMTICQQGCRSLCVPECELCKATCRSLDGASRRSCLDTCTASNVCITPERCGNGRLEESEQCDDGNLQDNDGCSSLCRLEFCGDGITQPPLEQCDDGNDVNDDTCSNECQPVVHVCGNGRIDVAGEECDDGNVISGDGCSATCDLEGACSAYEAPTTPLYPCGPTVEIGSAAELVALLPSQWPNYEDPVVFPISPNVRASADLTLTSADLPAAADVYWECKYLSWLCVNPEIGLDWRFPSGADTAYRDANGLHIKAGAVFRVSAMVFNPGLPPFFPVVVILRSCEEPCFSDETRCLVDEVCYRDWEYCPRCLGLSPECCACTDLTGAADDGVSCSFHYGDIRLYGSCFAGYCQAHW